VVYRTRPAVGVSLNALQRSGQFGGFREAAPSFEPRSASEGREIPPLSPDYFREHQPSTSSILAQQWLAIQSYQKFLSTCRILHECLSMSREKPRYELSEEVRIVLECSSSLVPCKKFRQANIYRFANHLKEGKCQQCVAWYRQTDKELKTIRLLAEWRRKEKA
jgi:hypothetical protein